MEISWRFQFVEDIVKDGRRLTQDLSPTKILTLPAKPEEIQAHFFHLKLEIHPNTSIPFLYQQSLKFVISDSVLTDE